METQDTEDLGFVIRTNKNGRWSGIGKGKCSIRDSYICLFEDVPFLVHKGYAMVFDSPTGKEIKIVAAGTSEMRKKVTKDNSNGKPKTYILCDNRYFIKSGFYDYELKDDKILIKNVYYYSIAESDELRAERFRIEKDEANTKRVQQRY